MHLKNQWKGYLSKVFYEKISKKEILLMLFKTTSEHRKRWKSSQLTSWDVDNVEPNMTVNTLDIKAIGQPYFGA